jgi:hypothetical protein
MIHPDFNAPVDYPRFQLRTDEVYVYDSAEQRREIAQKMAARGFASPLGGAEPQTPEETAEHFGREMFRLYGKTECHRLIGLATGAAMRAERDAMGEVK